MKLLVYLFIIVLSVFECTANKGWNTSGYKDEVFCSLGWSGYLKRLSLIIFMLSGVILYYVPNARCYFRRGCHDMIDFVADGLHVGLNNTDTEYTVDYSSSSAFDEDTEEIIEKQISHRSTNIIEENRVRNEYIRERRKTNDLNDGSSNESLSNRRIHLVGSQRDKNDYSSQCHFRRGRKFFSNDQFSTQEDATLPIETIQLYPDGIIEFEKFSKSRYFCPSERDSDISDAVSLRPIDDKRKIVYMHDEDPIKKQQYLVIDEENKSVIETEPTIYPEEESIGSVYSDPDDDNTCRRVSGIEKNSKTRTKLDKKLREFEKTLRTLHSSFSRKHSSKCIEKEEYAVRIIESILQTVKRSFAELEDSGKNVNRKRYRKSRGTEKISGTQRISKTASSVQRDRQLVVKTLDDHCFYPGLRSISSSKRKLRTSFRSNSCEDSKERYNLFLIPEDTLNIPILTGHVKSLIERAARWFFGRCPNETPENETPTVGSVGIGENK